MCFALWIEYTFQHDVESLVWDHERSSHMPLTVLLREMDTGDLLSSSFFFFCLLFKSYKLAYRMVLVSPNMLNLSRKASKACLLNNSKFYYQCRLTITWEKKPL